MTDFDSMILLFVVVALVAWVWQLRQQNTHLKQQLDEKAQCLSAKQITDDQAQHQRLMDDRDRAQSALRDAERRIQQLEMMNRTGQIAGIGEGEAQIIAHALAHDELPKVGSAAVAPTAFEAAATASAELAEAPPPGSILQALSSLPQTSEELAAKAMEPPSGNSGAPAKAADPMRASVELPLAAAKGGSPQALYKSVVAKWRSAVLKGQVKALQQENAALQRQVRTLSTVGSGATATPVTSPLSKSREHALAAATLDAAAHTALPGSAMVMPAATGATAPFARAPSPRVMPHALMTERLPTDILNPTPEPVGANVNTLPNTPSAEIGQPIAQAADSATTAGPFGPQPPMQSEHVREPAAPPTTSPTSAVATNTESEPIAGGGGQSYSDFKYQSTRSPVWQTRKRQSRGRERDFVEADMPPELSLRKPQGLQLPLQSVPEAEQPDAPPRSKAPSPLTTDAHGEPSFAHVRAEVSALEQTYHRAVDQKTVATHQVAALVLQIEEMNAELKRLSGHAERADTERDAERKREADAMQSLSRSVAEALSAVHGIAGARERLSEAQNESIATLEMELRRWPRHLEAKREVWFAQRDVAEARADIDHRKRLLRCGMALTETRGALQAQSILQHKIARDLRVLLGDFQSAASTTFAALATKLMSERTRFQSELQNARSQVATSEAARAVAEQKAGELIREQQRIDAVLRQALAAPADVPHAIGQHLDALGTRLNRLEVNLKRGTEMLTCRTKHAVTALASNQHRLSAAYADLDRQRKTMAEAEEHERRDRSVAMAALHDAMPSLSEPLEHSAMAKLEAQAKRLAAAEQRFAAAKLMIAEKRAADHQHKQKEAQVLAVCNAEQTRRTAETTQQLQSVVHVVEGVCRAANEQLAQLTQTATQRICAAEDRVIKLMRDAKNLHDKHKAKPRAATPILTPVTLTPTLKSAVSPAALQSPPIQPKTATLVSSEPLCWRRPSVTQKLADPASAVPGGSPLLTALFKSSASITADEPLSASADGDRDKPPNAKATATFVESAHPAHVIVLPTLPGPAVDALLTDHSQQPRSVAL